MSFAGAKIIFRAWDLYEHSAEPTKNETYIVAKQADGDFGYIPTAEFALTSSNVFTGNQTINGNLIINGDINANQFLVTTASVTHYTASTNFGLDMGDTHTFTGSVRITGSFDVIGANSTLGNTTITGSFLVTGSTTQIGNNTLLGNTILSGSINISGSTIFNGVHTLSGSNTIVGNTLMTGTNTIVGNTVLSGSIEVSGSSNFHNSIFIVTGSTFFTGSHHVDGNSVFSGSINIASGSSYYRAGNKLFNYGQWGSLETQSGSANTAYAMKLDMQYNGVEGVYVANNDSGYPTRLTVENTGLYNIQFSAQLHATTNQAIDFSVWFAMTGSNMADSNTDFSIEKVAGGGFAVAALNLLTPITAGDYVELYWSNTTGNGQLQYKAPQSTPTRPATPSVILTITQVA